MLKKICQTSVCLSCIVLVSTILFPALPMASATKTAFQVNVKESLSVSITTPSSSNWATGDAGEFLRNKVSISVVSNGTGGFTAGMTTSTSSTALTNTIKTTAQLNTLGVATWTRSDTTTTNFWGYSTDDENETGTYKPMVGVSSAPITILAGPAGVTTGSADVYFGAKADLTQASGTYTGTVVISVVTDTNGDDIGTTPSNPAVPGRDEEAPYYNPSTGGANGATTYTYSSTNVSAGTTTTTMQVSDGDNRGVYSTYTPPQGVTENTISNIASGSSMATVLATTASVAAASGIFFFIVAKRKKDDDEEDEQSEM